MNVAMCLVKQHAWEEAIASCTSVLKLDPASAKARLFRARALASSPNRADGPSKAREDLAAALALSPGDKVVAQELASVEARLGLPSSAAGAPSTAPAPMVASGAAAPSATSANAAGGKSGAPLTVPPPAQAPERLAERMAECAGVAEAEAEETAAADAALRRGFAKGARQRDKLSGKHKGLLHDARSEAKTASGGASAAAVASSGAVASAVASGYRGPLDYARFDAIADEDDAAEAAAAAAAVEQRRAEAAAVEALEQQAASAAAAREREEAEDAALERGDGEALRKASGYKLRPDGTKVGGSRAHVRCAVLHFILTHHILAGAPFCARCRPGPGTATALPLHPRRRSASRRHLR